MDDLGQVVVEVGGFHKRSSGIGLSGKEKDTYRQ